MLRDPRGLIEDFNHALDKIGFKQGLDIDHESQQAPHHPHSLPAGKCAVYAFSLTETYGRTLKAGPHRMLKVGKAGPRSNARFQYQHYDPRSGGSTLAGSLTNVAYLWPYLGMTSITETKVADWIKTNTDRDNFYLEGKFYHFLGWLEGYVRAVTGPVFEGVTLNLGVIRASGRASRSP